MSKLLENLEKYLIYLVLFLVPLAVIGVFANPFEIPKVAVLIFGVTLLLFTFSLSALLKGSVSVSVSNFDLPVLLIGVLYLVSGILQTPNKMEAFLIPGTASVIFAGGLFYFLLNRSQDVKKMVAPILTLSAALTAAASLLAY